MQRPHLPVLLFLLLFTSCKLFAQGGTWVWMNGTNTLNSTGSYGTIGVASSSNYPPGMYQGIEWTDNSGNFWVFGGFSQGIGEYSALWKFDPVANLSTWVNGSTAPSIEGVYGTQGVPSAANHPGSRAFGAASWTDKNGDLWLFGGRGYDADDD